MKYEIDEIDKIEWVTDISNMCWESYPCQHNVVIKVDGKEKHTSLTSSEILKIAAKFDYSLDICDDLTYLHLLETNPNDNLKLKFALRQIRAQHASKS